MQKSSGTRSANRTSSFDSNDDNFDSNSIAPRRKNSVSFDSSNNLINVRQQRFSVPAHSSVTQSLRKERSIVGFLLRSHGSKNDKKSESEAKNERDEEETIVKTGKLAGFTRNILKKNKSEESREKNRYFKLEEFPNGDIYEGEWYEEYMDGVGRYVWSKDGPNKGDVYEGGWAFDKRHGEGVMTIHSTSEEYSGQFKDDMMHGKGVLRNAEKDDIYSGVWKDGERNGIFSVVYDGWMEVTVEYKENIIVEYTFDDEDISFDDFNDIPDDIRNSCLWTDSSSYSIYTFCIFTLLQFDQFPKAFDKWKVLYIYIQANMITACSQAYILWRLWSTRPFVQDSLFCESSGSDPFLYVAILIVFVTQKLSKFKDVRRDLYTVVFGRRFYSGDTRKIRNITTPIWARFIAVTVATYEVGIWCSVLLIGAYYIITTSGVSNVVQAAVSISYITEIDSMAMMYLPLVLRSNKTTFYEVPKMKNASADLGLNSQEAMRFLAFPPFFIISIAFFFMAVYITNCTNLVFRDEVSNLNG